MSDNRKLNLTIIWIASLSIVALITFDIIKFSCLIYKHTGLVCPSCGATRMVLALMDGNIYQAFRFNPYLLVTLAIPLIYLIDKNIKYIKKEKLGSKLDIVMFIYIITLLIYGLLRNIDTFSWMLPTIVNI